MDGGLSSTRDPSITGWKWLDTGKRPCRLSYSIHSMPPSCESWLCRHLQPIINTHDKDAGEHIRSSSDNFGNGSHLHRILPGHSLYRLASDHHCHVDSLQDNVRSHRPPDRDHFHLKRARLYYWYAYNRKIPRLRLQMSESQLYWNPRGFSS